MGEDVPGYPAGLRNMQDPTIFGDPDRTGSPNYVMEPCCGYPDNDGVHSNSGVGNKTFYLASQGGTFNGQTITGIDVGDSTLTKSAKLWLLVDQTLASGSDYADLGVVLDQSCQTLLAAGTHGFTAANCTAVHQAGLATAAGGDADQQPAARRRPGDVPGRHDQGGAVQQRDRNAGHQVRRQPGVVAQRRAGLGPDRPHRAGRVGWRRASTRRVRTRWSPSAGSRSLPASRRTCTSSSGGCSSTAVAAPTTPAPSRSTTPATPANRSTPRRCRGSTARRT